MSSKIFLIFFLTACTAFAQPYPDQHYYSENEELINKIESMHNIEISEDGKSIVLKDGVSSGYALFQPDSSAQPFNRGLPSWNGHVPNDKSSFKVVMRFYKNGWSPWLTVGFWKSDIWGYSNYGPTSYSGGKIDYDYAVLNSYHTKWQFQVLMKRTNVNEPSPEVNKLSFFVSDQKTTDNVNITSIVNDKPAPIFIDTQHFWQYSLDPEIGGSICSPTSVAMVLRSYDIDVDPLQFAKDNLDPHWKIFGVWPRSVQNGAEYGIDGAVTRYRTWSETRETLAAGGRVVMSVGSPLYPVGHLLMLAGFDSNGNPITHDPAKSNGYSYKHNKTNLSRSWFEKGGVAYTFFPKDTTGATSINDFASNQPKEFKLLNNFPNPFNPTTQIRFILASKQFTSLKIYDILGNEVALLVNEVKDAGEYTIDFNADNLTTGFYFYSLQTPEFRETRKMLLLK